MAYAARRQYSIKEYLLRQSLNPEHELLAMAANYRLGGHHVSAVQVL